MHIKIEYALIAYQEIIEAQRRRDRWQFYKPDRLVLLSPSHGMLFHSGMPRIPAAIKLGRCSVGADLC